MPPYRKRNPHVWKQLLGFPQRFIVWPLLKPVEHLLIKKTGQPPYPPIFMTSPPRSGSTLLYQVMCRGLRVCYFSNLMIRFVTSPVLTGKLTRPLKGCHPPEKYQSWYGVSRGWNAPHQGVELWERWFGHGAHYMRAEDLSAKAAREMSATIAALEMTFGMPFLNKWQGHAVHLPDLADAFPSALFIRISRDPLQVAQSILKSRRDLCGDPGKWTSAMPSEIKEIQKKGYIDQVCEQIYYLEKNMDEDSLKIGRHRFLHMRYEDLCRNPKGALQQVREFYHTQSKGVGLELRDPVPESFPCSRSKKVPDEDYQALCRRLKELFPDSFGKSSMKQA